MGDLTTFTVDPSTRRVGAGRVIIGGSPLKLFRLTDAGARLLDSIDAGQPVAPTSANLSLLDRLLDAGVLHPVPPRGSAPGDVTVVIPAFNTSAEALTAIVACCAEATAVIVVDDASPRPIGEIAGATVVRRATNGGPGAARQTGLDLLDTPFVAFVDTDVSLPDVWLSRLLEHFSDPKVGLIAPRVASTLDASLLARYDSRRSPLDLGQQPDRVRAGSRVSYLPLAAVVARVDALRDVGGFDPDLRVGEDVDLVWRLDEAGFRVRYEPSVTVHHAPRRDLRSWITQRFAYGTSAAPLARRHRGAVAPVRVSAWSAASWAAAATGWPVIGGLISAITTALLARKLRGIPDGPREAVRLAGLGNLYAGRSLASAVTRAWWPIALVLAIASKRCRRAMLLAAFVPPLLDWLHDRPPVALPAYVGLRVLDDVAYGTGVANGCLHERSIDAITPDFTSWPNSREARVRQRTAMPTADR